MLGHKSREFKRQVAVSLEALVPADKHIDLSQNHTEKA
jgi:hypothetical protein